MINASQEFKQALQDDKRDWVERATITLTDGTVLNITNEHIWGGGFEVEDAVSDDSTFGAIGAVIVNKATLTINNIYDDFSVYDFTDATVDMRIGLELSQDTEMLKKGIYTVDEATYNGSIITLECLDRMVKFDRPYTDSRLSYPATLGEIVRDACTVCLGAASQLATLNFPHYTFNITKRPTDDALTFREVLSWVAQIAGCYARINNQGKLELKWFDTDALKSLSSSLDGGTFDTGTPKYASGDKADGGSFNPWNTKSNYDTNASDGDHEYHVISSMYDSNIAIDDTIITGVQILVKTKNKSGEEVLKTYKSGSDGYKVSIEENDLITTSNAQQIVNWLGAQLNGVKFRKADTQHSSNPTIEAGDVALIRPRKGNQYGILVTRTVFSAGAAQTTVSASETPVRNSATRYSNATKNYVALRDQIADEKTEREVALAELSNRLSESSGLYSTVVQAGQKDPLTGKKVTGGNVYYMHDRPNVLESSIVWKMTAEAWGVSTNGGGTWNGGMTVDGDVIARILSADGVNADWIKSGTIRSNDGSVSINLANGKVTMNGNVTIKGYVKPSDLSTAGTTTINGSNIKTGTINANLIKTGSINASLITTGTLSANLIKTGSMSAERITSGTMSAARIKGGTLTLGGSGNGNGVIEMKNASSKRVGRWDKDALYLGNIESNLNAPTTKISANGTLTAKKAEITGAITATSGQIGAANASQKITIGTNSSYASIYYGMSSLSSSNNGFYIGTDGIALGGGKFKVAANGSLVATDANIRGNITATSGSFTGTVNATSGSFTGTINATSGSFTGTVNATSGTFNGSVRTNDLVVTGGSITIGGVTITPSTFSVGRTVFNQDSGAISYNNSSAGDQYASLSSSNASFTSNLTPSGAVTVNHSSNVRSQYLSGGMTIDNGAGRPAVSLNSSTGLLVSSDSTWITRISFSSVAPTSVRNGEICFVFS